uniref:Uncharacterized protein n=1 Tax=Arundo donax TaxID=35708 RepID=A0A0A9BPH9_ARUDO
MSGNCAVANMKANAAGEEPQLVVTDPVMAQLITRAAIMFSIALIGIYLYTVYSFLKLDGPWWEAFAWSAAASPLCIAPLCAVPKLRDAFLRTYAMGAPHNTGNSGLNSKLLVSDNV